MTENRAHQILWDSIKAQIIENLTCGVHIRKERVIVVCVASQAHVCVHSTNAARGRVNVPLPCYHQ